MLRMVLYTSHSLGMFAIVPSYCSGQINVGLDPIVEDAGIETVLESYSDRTGCAGVVAVSVGGSTVASIS